MKSLGISTREIILSVAVVVLLFLYLDKDVEVVEQTITQTDTIYVKQKPINLTYTSQPVKIEPIVNHISDIEHVYVYPKSAKRYTYKDSVPNGEITSEIIADTIYNRTLTYNITPIVKEVYTTTEITKFDNRLSGFAYFLNTNIENKNPYKPDSYWFDSFGLGLMYDRNKWGFGLMIGRARPLYYDSNKGNVVHHNAKWNSQYGGIIKFKIK